MPTPPISPTHHDPPTAPRGEFGLLIVIAVLAAIAFSPIAGGISIAGVSLVAWLLWFIMFAAPAAGLALALRDREE